MVNLLYLLWVCLLTVDRDFSTSRGPQVFTEMNTLTLSKGVVNSLPIAMEKGDHFFF